MEGQWGESVERALDLAVAAPDDPFPGQVPLSRAGWMRAAVPQPVPGGALHLPATRADHVRWFAPRDRVLARYLNEARRLGRVAVRAADGKALAPCHPARARALVRRGRAAWVRRDPPLIRLRAPGKHA